MRLVTVYGLFDRGVGQVVQLDIPNLSSEAALRLDRNPAAIRITMVADPMIVSTHPRWFKMIGEEDLPVDYIKYVGTFPLNGVMVHVIEVGAQTGQLAGVAVGLKVMEHIGCLG